MKKNKYLIAIAMLFTSTILMSSCSNNSEDSSPLYSDNTANNSYSDHTSSGSKTQQESPKIIESIDGVYTGSQNISGLELIAKITISGNRWSATSQLGYDSPEYNNGVVKDNALYDDSGMIKIGYVIGNIAEMDGYPTMRKRQ